MMLTPSQLAVKPNVASLIVPDYDFDGQTRGGETLMAGGHTSNSIQTFDNRGQPSDARSDSND